MTNRLRAKVRFVKCPKCANILQEPEQVPLYACGGCDTILQAKYYRGDCKATGLRSLEQSIVQSNNDGHATDGGESGSLSQRSSSSREQSTDQNGWRDMNADESCKQEQIGAPNSAYHALLSEESSFLNNQGNGVIESKTDLDRRDDEVNPDQEQREAANSAIEASFTKGVSVTVLENKDSEKRTMANPVIEDVNGQEQQCNEEDHNVEQIGVADSARDTSAQNESQVIENKEPLRYAPDHTVLGNTESQDSVLNGAIENEDDQQEQSSDIAFDKQKQVREVNYAREASVLNESLAIENKESLQLASDKGNGSDHNSSGETRKENLEGEHSHGTILVDEIHYPDLERPLTAATLSKENEGKDQNDLLECTREQVGSMNLSEAPSLAEIAQGVNDASIVEINTNSGTCRSVGASSPNLTDIRTTGKMGSFAVFQEPRCESSSVDKLSETSTKKVENFDDCAVDGSEHVKSTSKPEMLQPVNTHREVGSSLEVVPRSLTKGSLAYDGSISSFDGNDDQILEQQEHIPDESLPGNGAVAGYVGAEESTEWSNDLSSQSYRSSRIQNQPKNSSQVLLDGKLKSPMLEEEESVDENVIPERNRIRRNRERFPHRVPFYRSSEVVYETGSSSSCIHEELPVHQMHHHPYRYKEPEPWLRNMYTHKGNMDRRRIPEASWRDNEFLSMYYNYETSGEFCHRSRYHNHMDRRRRGESLSQSGSFPPMPYSGEVPNGRYQMPYSGEVPYGRYQMPYSGEVPNGRYQMQDPYMHCHPDDDLWWSAQLAPPVSGVHCRQGLCAAPSREISWDPYDSSPPRFMDYERYSWFHDSISFSDDQRHKDQAMRRLCMKEKRQTARRYFQPMAGGAPFVTCDFCFKVLQLPKDFLLSRSSSSSSSRTHRLRCGDCSKILEFTFENASSLAPCKPNANACVETNLTRNIDSHVNHSRGSSEKSKVESRNSGNIERVEGSHNAAVSSGQTREMKVTWQLPDRKSPLHRLMGYSSPNVLLNGHESEEAE